MTSRNASSRHRQTLAGRGLGAPAIGTRPEGVSGDLCSCVGVVGDTPQDGSELLTTSEGSEPREPAPVRRSPLGQLYFCAWNGERTMGADRLNGVGWPQRSFLP